MKWFSQLRVTWYQLVSRARQQWLKKTKLPLSGNDFCTLRARVNATNLHGDLSLRGRRLSKLKRGVGFARRRWRQDW
jgi:hypothetical protein